MYEILYSALVILSFKNTFIKINKGLIKLTLLFLTIILTLMSGFRFHIGVDYNQYISIFNGINTIHDYNYLEIGFRYIIVGIKWIISSEVVFLLIFATISLIFLYKGICDNSKNPMLSIFIFFTIFYVSYICNAMRQGVAMCMFLYSLKYYNTNEYRKIILITLAAMSIHNTGIIIYISYLLRNIDFKFKHYCLFLIIGIVLCYINPFEKILTNISLFGIDEKILRYSENFEALSVSSIIQRVILIGLFILNLSNIQDKDRKLLNIYMIGWLVYTALFFQGMGATRINMFFRMLEIIIIPNLIYNTKDRGKKIILFCFVIVLGSFIFSKTLGNPYNYPYRSIWHF